MIDKQKLLQWIEDKRYVYNPSAEDSADDANMCKGARKVLVMLEMAVESGTFNYEEYNEEEDM